MLAGERGSGTAIAMRVVLAAARALGAARLRPISRAHVDGCMYHGDSGLEFAELLLRGDARVRVPTTLNVGLLDLLHPEINGLDQATSDSSRRLLECYQELGCSPTFTCAPYQLPDRPQFGEQIAWAESNAIVFANSVLGARTNRYGDLVDICAAVTGRVPDAGLHLDQPRAATVVFDVAGLPERVRGSAMLTALVGLVVGARAGERVPAIVGLPGDTSEDELKALGAAAASSGSVALFHAVGLTPEAPDLDTALHGAPPAEELAIGVGELDAARRELGPKRGGPLVGVSVGTPHASPRELRQIAELIDGHRVAPGLEFSVSTNRHALSAAPDAVRSLEAAGVQIVVDTCTYVTPIMRVEGGLVMTNSAKWAYYAPALRGASVVFGSLTDCVSTAVTGKLHWEPLL